MISWLFLWLGVYWISAIWFLVVDVFLALYMRDSVLLFFNVFIKNKSVVNWQVDGVKIGKDRQKKSLSIIFPLSVFVKVTDEVSDIKEEIPPPTTV